MSSPDDEQLATIERLKTRLAGRLLLATSGTDAGLSRGAPDSAADRQ